MEAHFQHACHTPLVALTGRQCHTKPDASSLAPVFAVVDPYPLADVSSLVASLAKVLIMSLAWQEQSSPLSRYGAWTLQTFAQTQVEDFLMQLYIKMYQKYKVYIKLISTVIQISCMSCK